MIGFQRKILIFLKHSVMEHNSLCKDYFQALALSLSLSSKEGHKWTPTHTHTNTLRRTHTQISKHMCTSTHTLQRTPLHCIQHHLEHVTPASAAAATPPTATPSAAAAAADETGQARAGADLSFSSVASAADFSSYLFHLSII